MAKRLATQQLVAQLEAAHVSYQALECRAARLEAELAAARKGFVPKSVAFKQFSPSEASVIAHDAYASALIKAKQLAATTGRCVTVSYR